MPNAYMSCLEELSKKERQWEYLFTLQNDDIQIKTNEEIIQIFKWLDGAMDIDFEFRNPNPLSRIRNLNNKYSWTFKDLNLFKDG